MLNPADSSLTVTEREPLVLAAPRGELGSLRVAQEAADAFERSRTGALFFVLVWILICATAGQSGWREWAIGGVFLVLGAARFSVRRLMRLRPIAHEQHLIATLSVMTLTMAAWGSVTAFALVHPDYHQAPTVILFATSAFTTAFVHNYPMRIPAAVAGLTAGYAPPWLALAFSDRSGALAITVGVTIHYAYLLLAARRSHYEYHRRIDLEQELRAQRDQFARRSCIDALTGLANRRELNDSLAAAVSDARAQQTPLSLLILDLDHFKAVNDTHGHAAGDSCLIDFATRLRSAFNGPGEVAARLGGEEFAVVMPGAELAQAFSRAESFRASVHAAVLQPPAEVPLVTVSIGVGRYREEAHADGDALYRAVDGSLYSAKHEGRNRVVALADVRSALNQAGPIVPCSLTADSQLEP